MYAIWNLTNACPWDCAFCCMSSKQKKVLGTKELSFSNKIRVLDCLVANDIKIDFSGGDPLFYPDDFNVVKKATDILPKEKIDVSTTGIRFNNRKIDLLKMVGKVEISMDNIPGEENPFRPEEFNSSAFNALKILVDKEVFCSAVTTLYPNTIGKKRLEKFYRFLCEENIPKWNILRFYPVGRGSHLLNLNLSKEKLIEIMDFLDSLKGSTKITFQHSLRILRGQYKCHAGIKAIGILPNGTVVSCGWALNGNSQPLPGFKIGKLPEEELSVIIKRIKTLGDYCNRPNYCRTIKHLKEKGVL